MIKKFCIKYLQNHPTRVYTVFRRHICATGTWTEWYIHAIYFNFFEASQVAFEIRFKRDTEAYLDTRDIN